MCLTENIFLICVKRYNLSDLEVKKTLGIGAFGRIKLVKKVIEAYKNIENRD